MSYIIACDPSGNWNEGKGTTGWAVVDVETSKAVLTCTTHSQAAESEEEYWYNCLEQMKLLVAQYNPCVVRIEDYILYGHKAKDQINSHLETPQLIGILRMYCFLQGITVYIRTASTVKNRFTDEILEHKGYIEKHSNSWCLTGCNTPICIHERDALRHAVACLMFDIGEDK